MNCGICKHALAHFGETCGGLVVLPKIFFGSGDRFRFWNWGMINPVQWAAALRNVSGCWFCFGLKPLQSGEVRDGPDIPLLPLVHPNSCRTLLAVAWRLWGCTCARDYRAGRLWRGGDGAGLVRFWIDVCAFARRMLNSSSCSHNIKFTFSKSAMRASSGSFICCTCSLTIWVTASFKPERAASRASAMNSAHCYG